MKQSKIQTFLFSTAGLALVFVALVGANVILSPVRLIMDLTADRLHTLSPGTKAILAKVDAPIQIRFYSSQGRGQVPGELKTYIQTVEDLRLQDPGENWDLFEALREPLLHLPFLP